MEFDHITGKQNPLGMDVEVVTERLSVVSEEWIMYNEEVVPVEVKE